MVPLTIALKVNCFTIFGGYMKPSLLLDERMNLDYFTFVCPLNMCNCLKADHDCVKDIDLRRIPRLQHA
jgi:hypothetical protein